MSFFQFESLDDLMYQRTMQVVGSKYGIDHARAIFLADNYTTYQITDLESSCLRALCEATRFCLQSEGYVADCTYVAARDAKETILKTSEPEMCAMSEEVVEHVIATCDRVSMLEIIIDTNETKIITGPDYRIHQWTAEREARVARLSSEIQVHHVRGTVVPLGYLCTKSAVDIHRILDGLYAGQELDSMIPGSHLVAGEIKW